MATLTYTGRTNLYVGDQETDRSALDVYGLSGPVKSVSVGIRGYDHGYANDVDLLLVAPDNAHNLVVMSDTGGSHGYGGANFSFSDFSPFLLGDSIITDGVYKPTDNSPIETAANWGLNIPTINHPAAASFASSFGGLDGNGTWSLYMRDDAAGDSGGISSWSMTVIIDPMTVALVGGSGDDVIRVVSSSSYSEGVFEINERGGVAYSGVLEFSEDGGAGNDIILTGAGLDKITAGSGRDTVHAGAGVDYITIADGDDEAGEVYDGGGGDDRLIHTGYGTLDLRDDTVQSIKALEFHDGGKVMVTAAEASMFMTVFGDNDLTHPDVFAVTMGASVGLDLGLIGFATFDQTGDLVTVTGDNDAETILGSKVNDVIKAGGGDDYVRTNLGRDTVDGGKGSDRIDYSDRVVSVKVTLKGSHNTNVKIDGIVEDKIKNIENVSGGASSDILTGDKNANSLIGWANDDILKGGGGNDKLDGGLGSDTMTGGTGRDQFTFISTDFADHIKDFSHADDTLALSGFVFTAFTKPGGIKAKAFHANASGHDAHSAKQHLLYDKSDGSVWYDADGNGAGAAVEIAVLDNKPKNLDFHDFLIA